jgi:tetratricopeptide (TPR) repeat protein
MSKTINKTVIKNIFWFLLLSLFFVFNFNTIRAAEISREARKHMLRGQAAMEVAKNNTDYQDAVKEFKKAIKYAPSWGDAWYNLGVAQEAAGDYAGAITSFNKYLNLNPQASDRSAIEDRIIKLEYKQEKAGRRAVEEIKPKPPQASDLTGNWINSERADTKTTITAQGSKILFNPFNGHWKRDKAPAWMEVNGFQLEGAYESYAMGYVNLDMNELSRTGRMPCQSRFPSGSPETVVLIHGKVSPDFKTITINYKAPVIDANSCRIEYESRSLSIIQTP